MYGGKNTLIGTSVDRREACSPDVILSKNLFFDSQRDAVCVSFFCLLGEKAIDKKDAICYSIAIITPYPGVRGIK